MLANFHSHIILGPVWQRIRVKTKHVYLVIVLTFKQKILYSPGLKIVFIFINMYYGIWRCELIRTILYLYRRTQSYIEWR